MQNGSWIRSKTSKLFWSVSERGRKCRIKQKKRKWLYVRGYSKEWEFLEDSDKEVSDEWSDALYRIRCMDGKVEKLEENNPVE